MDEHRRKRDGGPHKGLLTKNDRLILKIFGRQSILINLCHVQRGLAAGRSIYVTIAE
jgi:hypothetical protein